MDREDPPLERSQSAPPLAGLRIIEFAGIGPGPFCAMMLADHGAEVIRIESPNRLSPSGADVTRDPLLRTRRSVALDLKSPDGVALARQLVRTADGLIEGYRPGVMERLGLGPDILLQDNPALIYGRVTGYGQTGPLAFHAGHDINYIALAGCLHPLGRADGPPTPPMNLLGDFAGGGMMLAFGMLAALHATREGGDGQVVDCAMTEGAALVSTMIWGLRATGVHRGPRGTNLLDTGAPFYDVYECADGRYLAVGAIEPQFYAELCSAAGIEEELSAAQMDTTAWTERKQRWTQLFKVRSRDEWCALIGSPDACVAPVLTPEEAPRHEQGVARRAFVDVDGVMQPGPAPRYSRSGTVAPTRGRRKGEDTDAILSELGVSQSGDERLTCRGTFRR